MAKDLNEFGITLDDALGELDLRIETAVNFFYEEFEDDWSLAERYYAGEVDLDTVEGRSHVVKTEVRDAIRNVLPSVMRTILQARKIVDYIPTNAELAPWVEQQSLYATQLFWREGGYKLLLGSAKQAMKLKGSPIKVWFEEDPLPEYVDMTFVPAKMVKMLEEDEDVDVISVDFSPTEGDEQQQQPLYDVKAYRYFKKGRIRLESVPIYEFFIDRNSDNIDDAIERGVHGHRRDVTVGEAISMGLDYDDWLSLDSEDPEQHMYVESSYWRRGYQKDKRHQMQSEDLLAHEFLLTQCYVRYDLDGSGRPQLYCFYLGGTSYEYLDHEEVDDSPFEMIEIDPEPFASLGHSIADLTIREQDTATALLRATVDNALMSNNPRHAADPMRVDFRDLMNNAIGAPIKTKGDPNMINTISIPFTGQQLLPLLQYLEQDVQQKTGVTKAAQGLDPDALQSTDKDAVRNTIALAQGQVELMVRNIVETGLIPIFRKMLKLSMSHYGAMVMVRTKGVDIPVPQGVFDPYTIAQPNIGLGTASPEQKMQALMFVLQKQEAIMQEMGKDNPFTSLTQIYNTIEDITELSGLPNVGRYFNVVTPTIEKQLAKRDAENAKAQQEQAEKMKPLDPGKAHVMAEHGKTQAKVLEIKANQITKAAELEQKSTQAAEELDFKYDELKVKSSLEGKKIEVQREKPNNVSGQTNNARGDGKSG
jgi:hypothetical protein